MRSKSVPITDDHIHIDPVNGNGLKAAMEFQRAGGSHLFLVSKPSSSFGIYPRSGKEFAPVFDATLRVAEQIRDLGLVVFPILGIHPAEITRLSEVMPLSETIAVMKGGLDLAALYIREGKACALKSGRPHYEVVPEILTAANDVLMHALSLGTECDCAVQIHAESGPCADILDMANKTGMSPSRVVKHYATPDTPLVPSMIATDHAITMMCRERMRFTMESDYMDEKTRPGAVSGPKSVPKYTRHLLGAGLITEEDAHRIHTDTPMRVYGVDISL